MFIVARPQIQEESLTPTRSKFVIEPLEPGFGYTVGNSLRRTLLSSIPGAAISSVRIEGVLHEFSTVCLLYTSPSPRDGLLSRMPSSA